MECVHYERVCVFAVGWGGSVPLSGCRRLTRIIWMRSRCSCLQRCASSSTTMTGRLELTARKTAISTQISIKVTHAHDILLLIYKECAQTVLLFIHLIWRLEINDSLLPRRQDYCIERSVFSCLTARRSCSFSRDPMPKSPFQVCVCRCYFNIIYILLYGLHYLLELAVIFSFCIKSLVCALSVFLSKLVYLYFSFSYFIVIAVKATFPKLFSFISITKTMCIVFVLV